MPQSAGEGFTVTVHGMRHADVSLLLRVALDPDANAAYVYLTEVAVGAAVMQRVVGVAGRGRWSWTSTVKDCCWVSSWSERAISHQLTC